MIKSCKNIDIKRWDTVQPYILDCITRHYRRYDFKKLITSTGGLTRKEYSRLLDGDKALLIQTSENIARECARQITGGKPELPPCAIRTRVDKSTGKTRLIGRESALQQCFDYIAVGAAEAIWKRRIVPQQASSIKGRGPHYGVAMISKWVKKDHRAAEWAKRHGRSYRKRCRYYVKLDIAKCYPSCRLDAFMRRFARDCGNNDLIWLWTELIKSHRVRLEDGTDYEGFMIGALPSQWACQYMLSFAYRYVMSLHYVRRGRPHRTVSHCMIFMDDILLTGPSRKNLKTAARKMAEYIRAELGLTIKPAWQILRLEESPIDMMGFRVHKDGNITVRPRIFLRARRMALRAIRHKGMSKRQAKRALSYKGYFTNPGLPVRSNYISHRLRLKWVYKTASHLTRLEARENGKNAVKCGTYGDPVHAAA